MMSFQRIFSWACRHGPRCMSKSVDIKHVVLSTLAGMTMQLTDTCGSLSQATNEIIVGSYQTCRCTQYISTHFIKLILVRKLLRYGRMSRGSLVVMSSSCQQHYKQEQFAVEAVEQSNSSGTREFAGENTLGRETRVFRGTVARGVAAVRRLFPQVRASMWERDRQKVRSSVARA